MAVMGSRIAKTAFIMGSNKFELANIGSGLAGKGQKIKTKHGTAYMTVGDNCVVLPRHGEKSNIPPHMINHRANMLALQNQGIEQIISFTSVGSLKLEHEPTHILMPDDYINIGNILTYFDDKIIHTIPGMDTEFRKEVFTKIKNLPMSIRFNGVYIQTTGPRLETRAEIMMYRLFGDVIGMTMASEATLATELGIKYANISIIDNYCNGIRDKPLTIDGLEANQAKNGENIEKIIQELLDLDN